MPNPIQRGDGLLELRALGVGEGPALTLLGQRPDLHDDGLARHPVGCVLQLPGQGSDLHAEASALGSGARVGAAKGVSPDDNGHYLRGRNRPKRWLAA